MTAHNANAKLIEKFYAALDKHDADAMISCYHANVRFSDPVFGELDREQVCAMWRMLCSRSKDLRVVLSNVSADDKEGKAHWDATYTFSKTKRPVLNRIDATFAFQDGLIVSHDDVFSFWDWSKQSLGLPGFLLGWTPLLRGKVSTEARKSLEQFQSDKK